MRDGEARGRDERVERWLAETRRLAETVDDGFHGAAGKLAAVLHQAAVLVELVRDGYAISIHLVGREIARGSDRR
jgi:hypothetical protein